MTEEIKNDAPTNDAPAVEGKIEIAPDAKVIENPNVSVIPEGFDEEIFDTESMSLKQDKVKERLEMSKAEIAKWEKQAKDMRRKLSKGIETPEDVKAYKENYTAPLEFDAFVADQDSEVGKFLNTTLDNIDKLALENGLTTQQANALKDNALKLMQDVHIIQQPEEIEKSKAKVEKAMKESLGDDFKVVMDENKEFVANYGIFDDSERKMLAEGIKNSPVVNTLLTKIRTLFDKSGTKIPVRSNVVNGLADDQALWAEYAKSDTTDARKMEIIQQRIASGRTNSFGSI